MAKTFRANLFVRLSNKLVSRLLRAGVPLGDNVLLTVPGRKSGQPRTTPVALGERDGLRWVLSPYGEVDWVRNLRAAGRATLTRGRRVETITAVELDPREAAPLIKHALAGAPSFLRAYFDVAPGDPLADFERVAPQHPVFLVHTAA